ncbi:MAG: bifunctional hydroxymethylpyrimidine kinase/phosphomethylpyrimidine kinase [Acidobacteria bacterium]|nr:bifunctional hydroxymethylpyrimidine kinase/phosphomethylpyrimidine kinase [Acidobacteriota bacterium]
MANEKKLKHILAQRPFRSILIKPKVYKALSVGASDPSGGTGIQADLKTFAAFDVYGSTVITALTAQNTAQWGGVEAVSGHFIRRQMELVFDDLGVQAVKTGLVTEADGIRTVLDVLKTYSVRQLIVDPVMLAPEQAAAADDIVPSLKELISYGLLVTPNLAEATRLTGEKIDDIDAMKEAALHIYGFGVKNVLIKGGHLVDEATDLFFDGKEFILLTEKKLPLGEVHGTGSAYSAAITAGLSKGMQLLDAIINAKIFVTRALKFSIEVGQGAKVLNFFV